MADVPGTLFVSKGILYVLRRGAGETLRPYTVGAAKAVAAKCAASGAWPVVAVAAVVVGIGLGICWLASEDDKATRQGAGGKP